MKKPSPATEEGPLPGLSETNYKVLAGVTALGVAAPALLFVSNVVLPEMTKCKPVHKSNCRRVSDHADSRPPRHRRED